MIKLATVVSISLLLGACSLNVPGLTSATNTPLEIKGYHIGDSVSVCSNKEKIFEKEKILICDARIASIANETTKSSKLYFYDGKLAYIHIDMNQQQGFTQYNVLSALTQKFGPPAKGGVPRTHIWTNGKNLMALNEIKGTLLLAGENAGKIQTSLSAQDSKDL